MPLNVTLFFPSSSAQANVVQAGGLKVQRYALREGMSELFELTVEILVADATVDERTIVGEPISVVFGDEPLEPQIDGIVRRVEQLTALPSGDSRYEWTIVPPLWLTTRRRDHRIFQHLSVPEIVAAVVTDPRTYKGRIPAPLTVPASLGATMPKRDYCVQYGETDHAFISRILADEGIGSFFDHENGSAWTLIEDTALFASKLGQPIPFSDPSNLNPVVAASPLADHLSAIAVISELETSTATRTDYDYENPENILEATHRLDPRGLFAGEADLEDYRFELEKYRALPAGNARAERLLQADRRGCRTFRCDASFALQPGTVMSVIDHPRPEINTRLLVHRAETLADFGKTTRHVLTCIDAASPFRPAELPKPRIHGTQTAIVVGAPGQEIDVDSLGRVEVEFWWDRRNLHAAGTTRRVRVAQPWAGRGYGFTMLPRVFDEVIVAYLDGDPDQPLIVGRVHNTKIASPLTLPRDQALSVWKSCSTPGGGGFNEIRMDDAAGAEVLGLKAERDFISKTGHDSRTIVGRHQKIEVGGNQTTIIQGDRRVSVQGNEEQGVAGDKTTRIFGDYTLEAQHINLNGTFETLCGTDMVSLRAPTIVLEAGPGSFIEITAGAITIVSPLIKLNP